MTWLLMQADARHIPLADGSVDLVFGSPPYCDARTYSIDAVWNCSSWVEWMLGVVAECLRVSRGPVIIVAAGVTRDRNYWPACEGLMWEWWKRGGHAYRPCIFHRVGIAGSGGSDWFRADTEYVMCFKRPGPLPWSENTAMGHPPKWAPGGEMSHRLSDGTRRNQRGCKVSGQSERGRNGVLKKRFRPSHRQHTKRRRDGGMEEQNYAGPAIANPGNVVHCKVGGGLMGSRYAHENEAPFPERLAEWFIRSCCPPGGIVFDPFSGSGTTVATAIQHGRRGIGGDIRFNQCEVGRVRIQATLRPNTYRDMRPADAPLFAGGG